MQLHCPLTHLPLLLQSKSPKYGHTYVRTHNGEPLLYALYMPYPSSAPVACKDDHDTLEGTSLHACVTLTEDQVAVVSSEPSSTVTRCAVDTLPTIGAVVLATWLKLWVMGTPGEWPVVDHANHPPHPHPMHICTLCQVYLSHTVGPQTQEDSSRIHDCTSHHSGRQGSLQESNEQ